MSSAAGVLTECTHRGIDLMADGDVLRFMPVEHVDDALLAEMREHKDAIMRELRRDAAAADAWERLRVVYERAGRPGEWLTGDVRMAEHVVSELWISSRANPDDDARFHQALDRWQRIAAAAIIAAAGGEAATSNANRGVERPSAGIIAAAGETSA